jgi:cytochrome c553
LTALKLRPRANRHDARMTSTACVRTALALALAVAGAAAWAQAPARPAAPVSAALPAAHQAKIAALQADPKLREQVLKQGAKVASFCANCHGAGGQSVKPDTPNLAGQNTVYVLTQLDKYHDGRRKGSFFMEGVVKAMSPDERFAVAWYYTSQPPKPLPVTDPAAVARGKVLYEKGCQRCHGANGAGDEDESRIAGQQPDYLDTSIRRYRENNLRSDEQMFRYSKALTDADIRALVAYIGSMK